MHNSFAFAEMSLSVFKDENLLEMEKQLFTIFSMTQVFGQTLTY